MQIILDNGHGCNTPGKRSPKWKDGSELLEYKFNRDIVKLIKDGLKSNGVESIVLVPELTDVSLFNRVTRVNDLCVKYGSNNCILISVHANAGGGTGWEAYTSVGKTSSDKYADILYKHAEKLLDGFKIRKDTTDGDSDKEEQFYIIKNTKCPAVLTENLFMDNESDCKFLMSKLGKETIANIHIDSILEILNKK